MKTFILIALLLLTVGCNPKFKYEYIEENEKLKVQVADLERKLRIALHVNTCWARSKALTSKASEKEFKMVGMYDKDTNIYADLRVFSLKEVKDINGKVFKTWIVDELTGFDDIIEGQYYKIPCNTVR
jgi:hypothetical protein